MPIIDNFLAEFLILLLLDGEKEQLRREIWISIST